MENESNVNTKLPIETFHEVYYKIKWKRCTVAKPITDEEMANTLSITLEQFRNYVIRNEIAPVEITDALLKVYGPKRVIVRDRTIENITTHFKNKPDL